MSTTNVITTTSSRALAGKVALITGGTTGIGLATARLFHEEGAQVVITGANADRLAAARRDLPDGVLVVRADARSLEDAERLAKEIGTKFGGLDLLFLNAGVARFAPIEAFDEAFYDDIMDVNVKGLVFTLQKVLPLLRPGASVLVNTSVVSGKGVANASVYSASKGALSALVRSLAVELAPRGVRVNAISPGPIATPIYDKLGMGADAVASFQADMTEKVPLRRFGAADEVARTALFLGSAAASYVTGTEISVDGGVAIS
jgi:NAD(P)-dependent dehydrogenase (short-subunit alcohol dehydrogenase family)